MLDAKAETCPYKRIRTVNLRQEGTQLLVSDELAMLFNVTKTEMLLLPGCLQITLHQTALGTVKSPSIKEQPGYQKL